MSMTRQPQQNVPVQVHQADDRIVLAAPMPGLEPQDLSVIVSGDKVTTGGRGEGSPSCWFQNGWSVPITVRSCCLSPSMAI
jgi:HSP20 family molecular chaperone IbpA